MAELFISKIKLPNGTTYDLRDQGARDLIAGGFQYIVAWAGTTTPVVANIPAGVVVTYNSTDYTGTLAASSSTCGKFYLVKSSTQKGTKDYYDEYITVSDGSTYSWEKLGDTQANFGALAEKNSVTLSKGNGANVLGANATFKAASSSVSFAAHTTDKALGEATTFTNASSSVSFASHTTDKVLGKDTTFNVTQPTLSVSTSNTNVKATASGAAVGVKSSDTFVKSYPGATSKLVTTSVPNVTSVGSASNWSFGLGSGDDADTLIISGGNGSAPTLGASITAATGALANDGAGSSVMTGLGTPTTASAATAVEVTAQPTISLATGAAAGTGVVSLATGISSATASGAAVSANANDNVDAITALGAGTAAAQQITVGTNDKIDAITALGAGTAAAQAISIDSADSKKIALYADLDVVVS